MDTESGEDAHLGILDQPLVVEGKRKRRSVQSFQSPESAPSKKKKVEVEEGSGVKLGDITLVDAALNKKKTDELRPLYKLLFDQQGTVSRYSLWCILSLPFKMWNVTWTCHHQFLENRDEEEHSSIQWVSLQ